MRGADLSRPYQRCSSSASKIHKAIGEIGEARCTDYLFIVHEITN